MAEPRATDPTNPGNTIPARRTSPEEGGGSGDHFTAPLGSSRSGHLRFTRGAHRIVIRADLHMRALYRARFGDRMPTIWVQRGMVTIRYPRVPSRGWTSYQPERPAEVALNASIPWDIEIRGASSRLVADLRGLRLGSLSMDGGASSIEVLLPALTGTVAMVILGGASNVAICRPEGVAARLRVEGGVTNLRFDDRCIGAAGSEMDLGSRDYDLAADRYDVTVTGGANNLSLYERHEMTGSEAST